MAEIITADQLRTMLEDWYRKSDEHDAAACTCCEPRQPGEGLIGRLYGEALYGTDWLVDGDGDFAGFDRQAMDTVVEEVVAETRQAARRAIIDGIARRLGGRLEREAVPA